MWNYSDYFSFIHKDRKITSIKIDVKHEAEAPHRIKTLTLHLFPRLLELGLCLLSAWSHQPPFRPVENCTAYKSGRSVDKMS